MTSTPDSKIILVEHRADYKCLYGMNLTLYLGTKVLVAQTIKEVVSLIKESDVALVFVNNTAYTHDICADIFGVFEKKNLKIPLFVIGHSKVPPDVVTIFDKSIQLRDVLQNLSKMLKVTAKDMANKEFPKYFPLDSEFIIPGWKTIVPIYINRNGHYVSAFSEGDMILMSELEKFGLDTQLYVDRDLRLKFVNSLSMEISAKLNDPNLTKEERSEMTATGHQIVMEQARRIGITESTMAIANECIKSMTKIVESAESLDALLNNYMSENSSYRYRQSLLICFIGAHIIKKIPAGSSAQQQILAFVAFFHNITLHNDEYVKIRTDKQLEESKFSDEVKIKIKDHALQSAKILQSAQDIPFEAATIVKQHHGSRTGSGFTINSQRLAPIVIIFILAEEWANLVLHYETSANRPSQLAVISALVQKYDQPGFRKILPLLHTIKF